MSLDAILWAVHDAPDVPARCVAVLVGLASHADDHGRNAYPSETTLAGYARKSVRQVRRDLRDLERVGLIRRGDQSAVAHVRPDRRPTVYDLAMDRTSTSARSSTSGRTCRAERADTHDRNGRTPTSAERSFKGPRTVHARTRAHAHARDDDQALTDLVIEELRRRTGRTVDTAHARLVIRQLAGERADIRDPRAFLATAIRADINPGRLLPTPTPPRYEREEQPG